MKISNSVKLIFKTQITIFTPKFKNLCNFTILGTTKEQLWLTDLDELLEKLDEVEEKEREDASASAITGGGGKMKKGKKTLKQEAMPSPHGIRIQPKIPAELRTKAAKAAASKDRKGQKAVVKKLDNDLEEDKDEFDMMVTDKAANRRLSDKLGFTPEKKQSVKKEPKASPKKAQKSKKNPWESGSEISTDDEDNEDMEVEKKERDNVRRNAATNKYKDYMSGSSGSDSDDDIMEEKTNGVNGNGKLVRFWREINNLDRTYNQDFQTVITFQYFLCFNE